MVLLTILSYFALGLSVFPILLVLASMFFRYRKRKGAVAFFHPYCNAGGGGERVLWEAVRAMQTMYPGLICYIYTGDDVCGEYILKGARQAFGIPEFNAEVHFINLKKRAWVEASRWPVFTMLGQSFGSIMLAMEALLQLAPEVYIDTMGYAFSLPLFRILAGSRTACYVHYPTISTDMLEALDSRGSAFNNRAFIAKSKILTRGKGGYYKVFAQLYGWAGACSQVTMVNSSWTNGHITKLWKAPTHLIYPPCDVEDLHKLSLNNKEALILSIAQFRPEKNHALQVKAFARLIAAYPEYRHSDKKVKLAIIGGCRHAEDEARFQALKDLAIELKVDDLVTIEKNVTFERKAELLQQSSIGLHTMWNEHFGIGLVEFMASGVIPIGNRSGGPLMDIVRPCLPQGTNVEVKTEVGMLAVTEEEYAECMHILLSMEPAIMTQMQMNARQAAERFSAGAFGQAFGEALAKIIPK